MDNVVRISLRVPSQEALKETLALVPNVHLDCGAPKRDADGSFLLNLYGTKADADRLAETGHVIESDEQYGQVLKQRQSEVAKGDRFEGGKIKPVGIGIKRP